MKKLFSLLFISIPFFVLSQSITADPALEPMKITTLSNNTISIIQLPLNGVIKLKVPILNKNTGNILPAGSCKVKIGLGSKLIVNPSFNLTTVNTSNYFTWTAISSGGQVQIIGDLINALPANFNDTAYFDVKGTILGNSTITTNFLVTNHNTNTTLSDENGANNIASIAYTIINAGTAVPVTFTSIFAENKNCSLNVFFDIENEINVNSYELEVSNDFTNFEKIADLKANNLRKYTFQNHSIAEKYQVPILLVRVKSIDIDGKFQYTEIKKISGICDSKIELTLYPNPIPKNSNSFYIQSNSAAFNGRYIVSITDMTGKLVETKELNLNNLINFKYDMSTLAAGQYLIKLFKKDNNSFNIFKIIKQ
jgi:Secretion system C-terminal sorting domain